MLRKYFQYFRKHSIKKNSIHLSGVINLHTHLEKLRRIIFTGEIITFYGVYCNFIVIRSWTYNTSAFAVFYSF